LLKHGTIKQPPRVQYAYRNRHGDRQTDRWTDRDTDQGGN